MFHLPLHYDSVYRCSREFLFVISILGMFIQPEAHYLWENCINGILDIVGDVGCEEISIPITPSIDIIRNNNVP